VKVNTTVFLIVKPVCAIQKVLRTIYAMLFLDIAFVSPTKLLVIIVKNVLKDILASLTVKIVSAIHKVQWIISAKILQENVVAGPTLMVTNVTNVLQDFSVSQIVNPVNAMMMAQET